MLEKSKVKLSCFLVMALLFMLVLAGCGGEKQDSSMDNKEAKVYKLRIGSVMAKDQYISMGAYKFAELVEERTNGQVIIQVHPNGELGGERDMIEACANGILDFANVSTGPASGFVPETQIFDLPFLFRDYDHAIKVLHGPLGQEVLGMWQEHKTGVVGLSWTTPGFRYMTNSKKAINNVTDVKGMKIRTMENPIHMAIWNNLGADATPIAFPELFTSLQQGVVDGQENPLSSVPTSKFYEVQDHIMILPHVFQPCTFLASERTMNNLPENLAEIVKEAAIEAGNYQFDLAKAGEETIPKQLEELGMKLSYPEYDEFFNASKPVYDNFVPKFEQMMREGIVDDILNTK